MGSRAVVVVCRDADGRARGASASRRRRPASVYTRTGRRFFDDAGARGASCSAASARALDAPGCWDELETDWVVPRLRAACRGRPRRRSCCARSTPPVGAAGARRARRERRTRLDAARRARRRRRRRSLDRDARPRASASADVRRRLPPLLLAGRRSSTTCGSRRSTSSPARASVHARPRPPLAHGRRSARSSPRRPGAAPAPRATSSSTSTDPASEAAAIAWWEELTGARRRGHGGQAARRSSRAAARARPARRSSAAAASTCASSTAPSTRARRNLERLRQRGLGRKRSLAAPRVRPRHRGARALRPRRAAATASTSACSASSRSRASRSTRGSDGARSTRRSSGSSIRPNEFAQPFRRDGARCAPIAARATRLRFLSPQVTVLVFGIAVGLGVLAAAPMLLRRA